MQSKAKKAITDVGDNLFKMKEDETMKKIRTGMWILLLGLMIMISLSACVNAVETKPQAEAFQGSCSYQTHIQNVGWQDWVVDGATAGTTGQSLRVEAVQISLVPKQ